MPAPTPTTPTDSSDELLSKLASDEIDRLLAEADAPSHTPLPPITPKSASQSPAPISATDISSADNSLDDTSLADAAAAAIAASDPALPTPPTAADDAHSPHTVAHHSEVSFDPSNAATAVLPEEDLAASVLAAARAASTEELDDAAPPLPTASDTAEPPSTEVTATETPVAQATVPQATVAEAAITAAAVTEPAAAQSAAPPPTAPAAKPAAPKAAVTNDDIDALFAELSAEPKAPRNRPTPAEPTPSPATATSTPTPAATPAADFDLDAVNSATPDDHQAEIDALFAELSPPTPATNSAATPPAPQAAPPLLQASEPIVALQPPTAPTPPAAAPPAATSTAATPATPAAEKPAQASPPTPATPTPFATSPSETSPDTPQQRIPVPFIDPHHHPHSANPAFAWLFKAIDLLNRPFESLSDKTLNLIGAAAIGTLANAAAILGYVWWVR